MGGVLTWADKLSTDAMIFLIEGRVFTNSLQGSPQIHYASTIESQFFDCRSTYCCQCNYEGVIVIPCKMIIPLMLAWMI